VRLSDGRKEKEGRYLMTFKERRLFVGVARVERFSGGRSVGWSVVGLLSERRCDKWRRKPRRLGPENVVEY